MQNTYPVFLTCVTLLLLPDMAGGQQDSDNNSPLAVRELLALKSTDGRSHEIEAIASGRSGNTDAVYVVERVSEKALRGVTTSPNGEYLFWKLDANGHVLCKEFIRKMTSLEPPCITLIPLPAPHNGAIIIGVFEEQFGWFLLRVDDAGKIVKSVKLLDEPAAFVAAVLLPDANHLLLTGQYGLVGNVWKVDLDGKTIWKKTYTPTAMPDVTTATKEITSNAQFHSIALTDNDGGFIAVGDFGAIDEVGLGHRSVWLVRCNEAGEVLAEKTLSGWLPSICSIGNEQFAILFGERSEMTVQSRVCVMDMQLTQQWEKNTELTALWIDTPAIRPIPSTRGFVLAGSNAMVDNVKKTTKQECLFFQYDANGHVVATTSIPIMQKAFLRTRIACESDHAYVAIQTKGRVVPWSTKEAGIFEIRLKTQNQ